MVAWDEELVGAIRAGCRICGKITRASRMSDRVGDDHMKPHMLIATAGGGPSIILQSQAQVVPVWPSDVLCFVEGATYPSILRLYEDYCLVVTSTVVTGADEISTRFDDTGCRKRAVAAMRDEVDRYVARVIH